MKIISKTLKLLSLSLLVIGFNSCSDDDNDPTPTVCVADAGTLTATESTVSLLSGSATISATANGNIVVPENYEVTFVLTSGTDLVIEDAGANPSFTVSESGQYTIHTLVAETSDTSDPNFLDLSVINFGTTTGADVLGIVSSNNLCASLDVAGAPVNVLFTVVELAIDNGFTSLAAALTATDLVTTLQTDGPFTVFAPTNDAFDDLLSATGLDLDNLNADQEALVRNILLNHVIIGAAVPSSAITDAGIYANVGSTGPNDENLSIYARLNGSTVEINGGDGTTAMPRNGADVTTADVEADNGVVHVINKVLLPPTIADMAIANPALSTLVAALAFADTGTPTVPYIATTSDAEAGPFTVFAPTNTAFGDVLTELGLTGFGEGTGELNAATTDAVLLVHIVSGNTQSSGLTDGTLSTLGGDITVDTSTFTLTDGFDREIGIITDLVDIQTANGVVHVVDRVIRPGSN